MNSPVAVESECLVVEVEVDLNRETNKKGRGVFKKIENVSDLEPILKNRLPMSVNVFNICKNQSKWSKDVHWYVFEGRVSSDSWIVTTYLRTDHGLEINVSRPPGVPVAEEIREAFSKGSFIDWNEPFVFTSVDTEIARLVADISSLDKGNQTRIQPNNLYYMNIEDAARLSDTFAHGEGFEVKSMANAKGEEFILSTWKYASKSSEPYVKDVLERNISSAVYMNGKIVSGVTLTVHGLIGMLHTLREHRGKGYAQSAMHSVMKSVAQEGLIPACAVERRNEASKAFQTKIGFKFAGLVNFVVFEKPAF